MRIAAIFFTTALLGGVASAQAAPASQSVVKSHPQAKAQTGSASAQSPFQPRPNTATSKSPQAPAKPQANAVPANKPAKPTVSTPQTKGMPPTKATTSASSKPKKAPAAVATAKAATPAAPAVSPGKRDPFVSPIAAAAMRNVPTRGCSTGHNECLVVGQIVLKGIVQMKSGNFALVERENTRRPYVLRENDALFNGTVVKITGDSIVFRENGSDFLGRPTSKEVIKKVSAPAV